MHMYVTQGLHRGLRLHPERVATIFGERRHTYRELASRVQRLAGSLQALGLKANDRVALLALSSDRYLECMLAVHWAGGVVCPLNNRWSPSEISFSLQDCEPSFLILDDPFLPLLKEITLLVPPKNIIHLGETVTPTGLSDYRKLIEDGPSIPDSLRHDDDLAFILYTGGTTGFPKGVMHSHSGMVSAAASMCASQCKTGPIYLHSVPLFHMAGIQLLLTHHLQSGTHVFSSAFVPESILNLIEREKVTDTMLVPTMLQMLLDQQDRTNADLSSLTQMYYGAAPITSALLDRAIKNMPNTEFIQGYGMTETAICVTLGGYYHTQEGLRHGKLRSTGQPTLMSEIKIQDEGRELPLGQVGEVLVRCASTMLGYWKNPQATAEVLQDGWVHTGDIGYIDHDGFVFIVDRKKDMIISGGENIYSSEVESCLSRHPSVASCVVIGIPHQLWGESVHAIVVLHEGMDTSSEAILQHCLESLTGYKCPRSIEFRTALPLSSTGKILKTELREPYWRNQAI